MGAILDGKGTAYEGPDKVRKIGSYLGWDVQTPLSISANATEEHTLTDNDVTVLLVENTGAMRFEWSSATGVTVTTSSPEFPAGVYEFTVPQKVWAEGIGTSIFFAVED
ncbi:MAG: hypothetical protein KAS32_26345, partial [Candidatus Peribacteraceae bacterium]|nr:hypothetical protein [Candidatus Peribacteraceae bacterium]